MRTGCARGTHAEQSKGVHLGHLQGAHARLSTGVRLGRVQGAYDRHPCRAGGYAALPILESAWVCRTSVAGRATTRPCASAHGYPTGRSMGRRASARLHA